MKCDRVSIELRAYRNWIGNKIRNHKLGRITCKCITVQRWLQYSMRFHGSWPYANSNRYWIWDWKADTSSNIGSMFETMNIEFQWVQHYGNDVYICLDFHARWRREKDRNLAIFSRREIELRLSSQWKKQFIFVLCAFATNVWTALLFNQANSKAIQSIEILTTRKCSTK